MKTVGIYTLANDTVYDHLVALLNSIERNISPDIPVCIIPYNQQLKLITEEIKSRPNVSLFENWESIQRWDNFVNQVWDAHPRTQESRLTRPGWYKGFVHRKFAAFDGDFERFIFYDADSLVMKPINDVLIKLDTYDLVFDDWEHAKPEAATDINLKLAQSATNIAEAQLRSRIHCNSFFGSHRGLFGIDELNNLMHRLIEKREVEWINKKFWWSSSALFNYMTMDSKYSIFNYTLSSNDEDKTGNCANADLFVNIDNILYNQERLKPIHRIHYMSYPASDFARLCHGEDVDIRYREEFLYYRFLKQPELKPQQLKSPTVTAKTNQLIKRVMKKIKRTIA
ncbi:methionine synthase [Fischerella thermalis CCMEE 5208]|uniref:Npun_R2821/Npun_R2822 family protein n=1 Tax=Fischerella thermalis TaxID=372787 RepID=UPI000C803A90|nr:Npun_R2821/Npun_R2822 family protein [Fischerella thermalis]PMB30167.1 methionine synthase [Fischerella thermalis CCMEE 5208]